MFDKDKQPSLEEQVKDIRKSLDTINKNISSGRKEASSINNGSSMNAILLPSIFMFSMWGAFGLFDSDDAEREARNAAREVRSLKSEIADLKRDFNNKNECVVIETPKSIFMQGESGDYEIIPKSTQQGLNK